MALSKKPYKGCRDLFPKEKRIQNYIFDQMKTCASLHSFDPYDGPLLEPLELYLAKSGEELINEQIYSFEDRGGRQVAIRPEMTPTLARLVAQIHREAPKPIRLFSIPNLMRYERPQRGRLREHWQFNCDIFGANTNQGEIEILQLLVHLFRSFGADETQFQIKINDRKLVEGMFSAMKINQDDSYALIKIIDRYKKLKPEQVESQLQELKLADEAKNLFDEYLGLEGFDQVTQFTEKLSYNGELISTWKTLCSIGLEKYLAFDPTVVRGLDYYTGIVFEVFDLNPENRRALCGGGRYDNLLGIFGENQVPGVGFGLGDVTLTDFLTVHKLLPDLESGKTQIALGHPDAGSSPTTSMAYQVSANLRRHQISVENAFSIKPKKVFQLAEKKKIPWSLIVEEKELKLKNLQLKNEKTFAIPDNFDNQQIEIITKQIVNFIQTIK